MPEKSLFLSFLVLLLSGTMKPASPSTPCSCSGSIICKGLWAKSWGWEPDPEAVQGGHLMSVVLGCFFSQRMRTAGFPPEWPPCLDFSAWVRPGPWGYMGPHPWGAWQTSSFWMWVVTVKAISCEWTHGASMSPFGTLSVGSEVELLAWDISSCKSCQSTIT